MEGFTVQISINDILNFTPLIKKQDDPNGHAVEVTTWSTDSIQKSSIESYIGVIFKILEKSPTFMNQNTPTFDKGFSFEYELSISQVCSLWLFLSFSFLFRGGNNSNHFDFVKDQYRNSRIHKTYEKISSIKESEIESIFNISYSCFKNRTIKDSNDSVRINHLTLFATAVGKIAEIDSHTTPFNSSDTLFFEEEILSCITTNKFDNSFFIDQTEAFQNFYAELTNLPKNTTESDNLKKIVTEAFFPLVNDEFLSYLRKKNGNRLRRIRRKTSKKRIAIENNSLKKGYSVDSYESLKFEENLTAFLLQMETELDQREIL